MTAAQQNNDEISPFSGRPHTIAPRCKVWLHTGIAGWPYDGDDDNEDQD